MGALLAPEDALGKAALPGGDPSPKQTRRPTVVIGAASPSQLSWESELPNGEGDQTTYKGSSWSSLKLQLAFGQWGSDDFS